MQYASHFITDAGMYDTFQLKLQLERLIQDLHSEIYQKETSTQRKKFQRSRLWSGVKDFTFVNGQSKTCIELVINRVKNKIKSNLI